MGGIGLTVSEQCRFLEVSRSGYYRWKARQGKEPSSSPTGQAENVLRLVEAVLDA